MLHLQYKEQSKDFKILANSEVISSREFYCPVTGIITAVYSYLFNDSNQDFMDIVDTEHHEIRSIFASIKFCNKVVKNKKVLEKLDNNILAGIILNFYKSCGLMTSRDNINVSNAILANCQTATLIKAVLLYEKLDLSVKEALPKLAIEYTTHEDAHESSFDSQLIAWLNILFTEYKTAILVKNNKLAFRTNTNEMVELGKITLADSYRIASVTGSNPSRTKNSLEVAQQRSKLLDTRSNALIQYKIIRNDVLDLGYTKLDSFLCAILSNKGALHLSSGISTSVVEKLEAMQEILPEYFFQLNSIIGFLDKLPDNDAQVLDALERASDAFIPTDSAITQKKTLKEILEAKKAALQSKGDNNE
jgi:hypothetical protein